MKHSSIEFHSNLEPEVTLIYICKGMLMFLNVLFQWLEKAYWKNEMKYYTGNCCLPLVTDTQHNEIYLFI